MTLLSAVRGNSQRLDGGAMFGNAPKALWSRYFTPDAENRISLACRALLVEREGKNGAERILLETGIGVFFAPALRSRFGVVEEEHVLLRSLSALGLAPADITHVILSHLHFDHAGGLLAAHAESEPSRLLFENARYVVGEDALARARHPHVRDRASFIPELPRLLDESGRLHVIAGRAQKDPALPGLRFHYSDGHTPGLLLTEVFADAECAGRSVVFLGDLVPGTAWVHLPMTMGYDRYPELLVDEKTALLSDLAARGAFLFYTHDPEVAMSRVAKSAEGRMTPTEPLREVVRLPL
jgi:glyoxylase-like metal-dependent hydrolase (beta-lactamase superfamily II)